MSCLRIIRLNLHDYHSSIMMIERYVRYGTQNNYYDHLSQNPSKQADPAPYREKLHRERAILTVPPHFVFELNRRNLKKGTKCVREALPKTFTSKRLNGRKSTEENEKLHREYSSR